MPLTPKQQRFVEEYLVDLNGSAAYRRAGYKAKNDRVSRTEAARLLANPSVAAAIAAGQAARAQRVGVTMDDVVRELKRIAFADPRKVMTWGPQGVTLIDSQTLDADAAACVAEASQTMSEGGGSIRLKLCSKLDALDKLARHLGGYKDKVEHSGSVAQVHVYLPQKDGSTKPPAA